MIDTLKTNARHEYITTSRVENKILEFIGIYNMLNKVKHVYVATSGGADSMVLLTFLDKYKNKLKIEVSAVHVNHGIRGETARRDAAYVESFCEQHNIDFKLFDAEQDGTVIPEAASEDWARQLRYGYFEQVLEEENSVIATAHTLSDQAETMLFRLARGTGLKGLCGIPVVRKGFIRPVMCITREEIEYLANSYDIEYMTDETNLGDDYARNKIRHNVIPVLKEINYNSIKSINKACERISTAMSFIEQSANEALQRAVVISGHSFDVKKFLETHSTLQEYMAMSILDVAGELKESNIELLIRLVHSISADSLESDTEELIGAFSVNSNTKIVVTNKCISINKDVDITSKIDEFNGTHIYGVQGYQFEVTELTYEQFRLECTDKRRLAYYSDRETLEKCSVVVVSRRKRDNYRFKPAKRMEKKLKGFITELKVPLADRDVVPMLENSLTGELLWVWGLGFTDGFTPTNDSKSVIKIRQL